MHRTVRLDRLLPHNNIGFGFSDDLEQFLLLSGGNFELVQGSLEFRSHDIPLFLANIQVRMGLLHGLSRVCAEPTPGPCVFRPILGQYL